MNSHAVYQKPKVVELLGVNVARVNYHAATQFILQWIKEQQRVYVCVAPAATLVDARRHPDYRTAINQAAMITPDGVPVVWLAKAQGVMDLERTYGPTLMKTVCRRGIELKIKHFLYGASQDVLEKLVVVLKKNDPDIQICGTYAPPYQAKAQVITEEEKVLINNAKPDILWVALGSPKQDFWMHINRPQIEAPVMVGVGAAFDFISGLKPQAPLWMQTMGLEWLFRLICEPQRLWKRYLIGNFLFIIYAIQDIFKKKQ